MDKIGLELDRVVFIGRTFEEYLDMFSITLDELKDKKVLDCPAGACSFTAIGNKKGLDVTACDIAYYHQGEALKNKGLQDVEHAMKKMEKAKNHFKWDYFKDVDDLKKHRLNALYDCANDMKENNEHYISVTLPELPFEDKAFDIILSAHFLFTYADRLSYEFHLKTLHELLRVAKEEVRIFPVVDLEGKRYEHLDKILGYLDEKGFDVEEVKASYEFQAHANSMLIIKNKD
ncbi:SAM-dependent methyltransferase [Ectobacillus funiculus]|uniref:SAM-dependent methyltransferase n=1 Tax=Ectobacillus funiculus TaxID=137993 RepID=A0ABV5WCD2_9BACI